MLDPITLAHRKHLVQSFASRGLIIDRGEGASLITRDGTRYLDLLTNYGVNILGHSHPAITAALHTQIDALINLHGSFANTSRAQALSALASVTPSHLQRVYFASGGAEAVESAIKFACRHTSKTHIIAMSGGYHGKSLGALSLTTSSDRTYQRGLDGMLLDVTHVPFGDADAVGAAIRPETAAIITEPIQGEGGIRTPPAGFFAQLRSTCDDAGLLLIIDEIQTGCGRTGEFCMTGDGIADIMTLGKGLGGGIPLSAVCVTQEIARSIPKGAHTSTYSGLPLAMAGLTAFVEHRSSGSYTQQTRDTGSYLIDGLHGIQSPHIRAVRGAGLMIGVELDRPVGPLLKSLQAHGIIAGSAGSHVLRLLPPLIITPSEIDHALHTLSTCLTHLGDSPTDHHSQPDK